MGSPKFAAQAKPRGRSGSRKGAPQMKRFPWKNPLKGGTKIASAKVGMKGMGLMVGFRVKF